MDQMTFSIKLYRTRCVREIFRKLRLVCVTRNMEVAFCWLFYSSFQRKFTKYVLQVGTSHAGKFHRNCSALRQLSGMNAHVAMLIFSVVATYDWTSKKEGKIERVGWAVRLISVQWTLSTRFHKIYPMNAGALINLCTSIGNKVMNQW